MRPMTKIIVWFVGVLIIAASAYFFLMFQDRSSEVSSLSGLQTRLPETGSSTSKTTPEYHPGVIHHELEKTADSSALPAMSLKQPENMKTSPDVYALSKTSQSSLPTSRQQKIIVPHISERQVKLKKIQSRLLKMIRKNPANIDIKQLDTVLAELDQLKDTNGLVGGMNIEALRQNLAVTSQVQELSRQIQQEAGKPPGQINMTKLQAETKQLQELQKKLLPANFHVALPPGQ